MVAADGRSGGESQTRAASDACLRQAGSYIERFHRSLKEEEVWVSEYQSLEEARSSIGRYLWEYNHDRPHRGLRDRTPREAFVSFESDLRIEALGV